MSATKSNRLIKQVASRKRLTSFARWFYYSNLAVTAVYVTALLLCRLLAITDDYFHLWTLSLIPAAALIIAALGHRKPKIADAAHLVDRQSQTKDLFLTLTSLDQAPGQFKPLVIEDAEQKAPTIQPARVVPFKPLPYLGNLLLAMAVVAAGILWLPQLDPFGQDENREKLTQREQRIKDQNTITINRANQLAARDLKAKHSKTVDDAIKELKFEFDGMKPNNQDANFKKLLQQQQKIGQLWKNTSNKKLRESLNSQSTSQRFGAARSDKMQKLEDQLNKGDSTGLKQEIDQIKDLVSQLEKTNDAAQQQQLKQEIENRIQELCELSKGQAGSKALNEALQRALDQMKMSDMQGLSQQAQQAMQQSLDLSKLELDQIAQNARDIQELQKALEALQQAKACSNCNKLGEGQGAGNSMQEYIDMYNKMLAEGQGQNGGKGQGGIGGEGHGRGGIAPEDPTQQTDFKTEKTQTHLTAGRIIMQFKTKGISEAGEVKQDYQQTVKEIKQGVSEAMLQEQIPPGYHDAIQKYFDNIEPQQQQPVSPETKEEIINE